LPGFFSTFYSGPARLHARGNCIGKSITNLLLTGI
jgi:hypothetical protein